MQIHPNLTLKSETKKSQPIKPQYRQSFKGSMDSVIVGTMDFIENGGLAASFIIQDGLGAIAPRTLMGALRGKKENHGKTNKALAIKEFLREITTGPSMFIIPAIILWGAKGLVGNALDVPADFLKGIGEIYKNVEIQTLPKEVKPEQLAGIKTEYYTAAFKKMLAQTANIPETEVEAEAKDMAELLHRAQTSTIKKSFIENIRKKSVPGSQQDLMGELTTKFRDFIKGSQYAAENPDIDFLQAFIKKGEKEAVGSSFGKAVSHIIDYTDDLVKNIVKNAGEESPKAISEFVESFTKNRMGQRFGLNLGMAVAVTAFLTQIPKIYNRTKENPALIGLDENVTKSLNAEQAKGA